MSRLTQINTATATLVGLGPQMLMSVIVGAPQPFPASLQIDFHNVNAIGDIAASNLIMSLNLEEQMPVAFTHTFDGAMFPAGLVIKCSAAIPMTLETE